MWPTWVPYVSAQIWCLSLKFENQLSWCVLPSDFGVEAQPGSRVLKNKKVNIFCSPPDLSDNDRLELRTRLRYQIMVQKHVWSRFHEQIIAVLGKRKKWSREFESEYRTSSVVKWSGIWIDSGLKTGLKTWLRTKMFGIWMVRQAT